MDLGRRGWILALAMGLLVRAVLFFDARDAPFWSMPFIEETAQLRAAEALTVGLPPAHGAWYAPPGYPGFLAAVWWLGGEIPHVKLLQLIAGSLSGLLLFLLGRRLFDPRVGLLAAALWALYPHALLHELLLLEPTLAVLAALFALWCIARPCSGGLGWLAAGTALGGGALLRSDMLVVAVTLVATAIVAARRGWAIRPRFGLVPLLALLLVGFFVAIPNLQNQSRGGEAVLVGYGRAIHFYMGNHAGADGGYSPLRQPRSAARVEEEEAIALAENATGHELQAAEVAEFWWNEGARWWAEEPVAALGLTLKKAALLWAAWESSHVVSVPLAARWVVTLRNDLLRPRLLMPLALLGIGLSWSRRRELWPLHAFVLGSQLALTPFFLVESFRLPLSATNSLFAGFAVFWLADRRRQRRWRAMVWALLVAALIGLLLSRPKTHRDESVLRARVGEMLMHQGRHEEALREFVAVRGTAHSRRPIEIDIAEAYVGMQRYENALQSLQIAVRILQEEAGQTGRPAKEEMSYCYELSGDLLARLGRASQARIQYDAAVRWGADELRVQRKLRALRSADR